jgi:hypothetical protein
VSPWLALHGAGLHRGKPQTGFHYGVRRQSLPRGMTKRVLLLTCQPTYPTGRAAAALFGRCNSPLLNATPKAVSRFACHRSPKRRVAGDARCEFHQQGWLAAAADGGGFDISASGAEQWVSALHLIRPPATFSPQRRRKSPRSSRRRRSATAGPVERGGVRGVRGAGAGEPLTGANQR